MAVSRACSKMLASNRLTNRCIGTWSSVSKFRPCKSWLSVNKHQEGLTLHRPRDWRMRSIMAPTKKRKAPPANHDVVPLSLLLWIVLIAFLRMPQRTWQGCCKSNSWYSAWSTSSQVKAAVVELQYDIQNKARIQIRAAYDSKTIPISLRVGVPPNPMLFSIWYSVVLNFCTNAETVSTPSLL